MILKRMGTPLLITLGILMACAPQQTQENNVSTPVEVMTLGLGEVVQYLTFNGDIKAEFEVKVFSKIPDRIEAFFVDEGDRVAKGDPIAKIVATTIEQGALQAEAGLTAARAQEANLRVEFERANRLYKENAMSRQQFDAIQTQFEAASAQVQQAEAALTSARSTLKDAMITAPISGIIGKRYYETGDMAAPALPVVSIVQTENVKIEVDATEEDFGKLKVGQSAEVSVRSYPDEAFKGIVSKISPILDPLTRMAVVEVLLSNPAQKLRPGMYAEVKIITGIIEDVLVVPRYAVIESTSLENVNGRDEVIRNFYVYVVNDSSKAEQRKLEVSYVNHIQLAVTAGVDVGDRLVVAGQNNLRDGSAVLVSRKEEGE